MSNWIAVVRPFVGRGPFPVGAALATACLLASCAHGSGRTAMTNSPAGPMQDAVPGEVAVADLNQWLGWLQDTHPDLSYSTDLSALAERRTHVDAILADGGVRRDVWAAMATLNPIFDDAHLGLRLPENDFREFSEAGGQSLSLPVRIASDGVFVSDEIGPASDFVAGESIVAVNGVRMQDFLAWITPRLRGESDDIRRLIAERRFALAFWTYAGGSQSYVVETRSEHGYRKQRIFDPARDVAREDAPEPFSLSFSNDVAILRVASFDIGLKDRFGDFAVRAFADIADSGVRRLVVDLRENGGGAHDVSDILMGYLTSRPHAATSSITARIVPANQALIPGARLGDVISVPFAEAVAPPADLPNRFNGDVVLLVGAKTYSQAIVFAATAQDLDVARIAGSPTAGRANQTAQVQRTTLENTGFDVQSPIYILTRASGEKGAGPLLPDAVFDGELTEDALTSLFD